MTYSTIRHDVDAGILTVTLDRPAKLNAFTVRMSEELHQTFVEANERDDVRAVIVTGSGRAFCAGMDLDRPGNVFGLDEELRPSLTDMVDLDDSAISGVRDPGGVVTLAIHRCRKPVIAAVNGPAVGIGATMTLAMDARLFSSAARFGLVFGRLGITPEAASTWFLPRIVGMSTALDLLYSAEILDASRAHAVGLADAIHQPDQLLQAAHELADRWTKDRSPVATALTRQMLWRNAAQPQPESAHRVESLALFYTSLGDGAEGVRAFTERRDAEFRGTASTDGMPHFYKLWLDED